MADESLSSRSPPEAPTTRRATPVAIAHLFGLLLVFIVVAAGLSGIQPPSAAPDAAPIETFSATRAMRHVRDIAKKPHPVGSAAHDEVRDLIVTRLRELGLQPEVQKTSTTQKFFGRTNGAIVENVVARIVSRGSDRRALLFAAHYDAVPQSFGAGDDGAGTAALLEAARALVQGPPLDRDVLIVITDGEELGLLGANAFVSEHAAAKDVVVAFNFDARGSKGALAMFDASNGNGSLIALLARVPHVQASSFVSTLAKLLPNDTDATIFKKAGIPTMSFAFADGFENYHRATDSADRLDPRSVQAMGDTAVSLARQLGRGPMPSLEGEDVAYVTLFGRGLVRLSFAMVAALGLGAALLTMAAAFVAVRRKSIRARGVFLGAGLALLCAILSGGLGLLLNYFMTRSASPDSLILRSGSLSWSAIALAFMVATFTLRLVAKRSGGTSVCVGAFCMLSTVGALMALLVPPVSMPFVATGLAAALPTITIAAVGERAPALRAAMFYLAASLAAMLWVPTLYSITIAAAANALVPTAVLAVPLALFVGSFATSSDIRAVLAFAGALVAVIAIGFVRLALPVGDDAPPRSTLSYGVDADRKQGFFFGSEPRAWMGPALSPELAKRRSLGELTLSDVEWWVGPAEVNGQTGAELERVERRRIAEGFEIRAVIRPSPTARCVSVWDETRRIIDVASVDGKPVRHLIRFSAEKDEALMNKLRLGGMRPAFVFQFCGSHGAPIDVVFQTREEAEVPVRLIEVTDGVPPAVGGAPVARPQGEIATDESDRTVVGKTIRL